MSRALKRFAYSLSIISMIGTASLTLANSAEAPIALEQITIDGDDVDAILRGGKFFAANCMVCHTMIYLKNDPLARKSGVLYDKMPINKTDWWFGVAPPDLSLIARIHSADWLYTYLHSFYNDPSRKQNNNNLLLDQTNMPNPFGGMQGQQLLKVSKEQLHEMHGLYSGKPRYFNVLELERQGTMSSEEFDRNIFDVVSFLVYASDPQREVRSDMGVYVLLFLGLLLVLTYLLKKEYWKGIK